MAKMTIITEKKVKIGEHTFGIGWDIAVYIRENGIKKSIIGNIVDINMLPESAGEANGDGYILLNDLQEGNKSVPGTMVVFFSQIEKANHVYCD